MPPEQPQPASPPEEKRHIEKGDETLPEKGNEEPLNRGEKAEAEAERLTTEYIAKGGAEADRAKQSVAKAVDNGRKGGLKIS